FDRPSEAMPVYPTMASRFNDPGVTRLYLAMLEKLTAAHDFGRTSRLYDEESLPEMDAATLAIIPPKRHRYLGEISETSRTYRANVEKQVEIARKWGEARGAAQQIRDWEPDDHETIAARL